MQEEIVKNPLLFIPIILLILFKLAEYYLKIKGNQADKDSNAILLEKNKIEKEREDNVIQDLLIKDTLERLTLLEDENKRLKESLDETNRQLLIALSDSPLVKEMRSEVDALKLEIKDLRDKLVLKIETLNILEEENANLTKENKELKLENENCDKRFDTLQWSYDRLLETLSKHITNLPPTPASISASASNDPPLNVGAV